MTHVVELHERVIRRERLLVEDVERRAADPPLLQGFGDGGFVHHRPARHVHEHRVPAHRGNAGAAGEAFRFGSQRAGEDHEIAFGKQRVRRHAGNFFRQVCEVALVADDLHAEAVMANAGDGLADRAHADDAHGLAGQLDAFVRDRARGVPALGPHQRIHAMCASRDHEHRRNHVLGHSLRIHAGNIGHRDAELRGRIHRNHVHARAMAHDAPEAVRTLEEIVRQLHAHDQHVAVPDHRAQRVGFRVGREHEVGDLADDVLADRNGRVGEQDFRAGHGLYFLRLERSGEAIGISDSNARAARNTNASA